MVVKSLVSEWRTEFVQWSFPVAPHAFAQDDCCVMLVFGVYAPVPVRHFITVRAVRLRHPGEFNGGLQFERYGPMEDLAKSIGELQDWSGLNTQRLGDDVESILNEASPQHWMPQQKAAGP